MGVRGVQRVRDLDRESSSSVERERPGRSRRRERLALEQLHGDEGRALVLVHVVDRADVAGARARRPRGPRAAAAREPARRREAPREETSARPGVRASDLRPRRPRPCRRRRASRGFAVMRDGLADHACEWRDSIRYTRPPSFRARLPMSKLFRLAPLSLLLFSSCRRAPFHGQIAGPGRWSIRCLRATPFGRRRRRPVRAPSGGPGPSSSRRDDGAGWSTQLSVLHVRPLRRSLERRSVPGRRRTGTALMSPDGGDLVLRGLPARPDLLTRAAWNGSRFVVVGEGGPILSSADG